MGKKQLTFTWSICLEKSQSDLLTTVINLITSKMLPFRIYIWWRFWLSLVLSKPAHKNKMKQETLLIQASLQSGRRRYKPEFSPALTPNWRPCESNSKMSVKKARFAACPKGQQFWTFLGQEDCKENVLAEILFFFLNRGCCLITNVHTYHNGGVSQVIISMVM